MSATTPTVTDPRTDTVSLVVATVPGHGRFAASADALDATIAAHLPASAAQLRAVVAERCGFTAGEYDDVTSVSALLVVLAATSGYDETVHGRSFD